MDCCSAEAKIGTESETTLKETDSGERSKTKRIVLISATLLIAFLLITSLPLMAHGYRPEPDGSHNARTTTTGTVPIPSDADIRVHTIREQP